MKLLTTSALALVAAGSCVGMDDSRDIIDEMAQIDLDSADFYTKHKLLLKQLRATLDDRTDFSARAKSLLQGLLAIGEKIEGPKVRSNPSHTNPDNASAVDLALNRYLEVANSARVQLRIDKFTKEPDYSESSNALLQSLNSFNQMALERSADKSNADPEAIYEVLTLARNAYETWCNQNPLQGERATFVEIAGASALRKIGPVSIVTNLVYKRELERLTPEQASEMETFLKRKQLSLCAQFKSGDISKKEARQAIVYDHIPETYKEYFLAKDLLTPTEAEERNSAIYTEFTSRGISRDDVDESDEDEGAADSGESGGAGASAE